MLLASFPPSPVLAAQPDICASPANCPTPEHPSPLVDPIWWNDHKLNQVDSKTFAYASAAIPNPYNTCGPATLALVVSYLYHLRAGDAARPVSTIDIMRMASTEGLYDSAGGEGMLGLPDLRKIAVRFGIRQVFPKNGKMYIAFSQFTAELRKGFPAIAGMRYDYENKTGRYLPVGGQGSINHFVVVIGFTDDGKSLWVLNTHPGIMERKNEDVRLGVMSVDDFRSSWARNDGSSLADYGNALFLR